MNWILLPLFISFLMTGYTAARAESAKVEGGTQCFSFSLGGNITNECVFSIKINGEIDSNTVDKVGKLLKESREGIGFKQLRIDSPGGNLAASMAIGRMLRKERMTLLISKGGECVSACIMILAGAVTRLWSAGKVGIHRPYLDLSISSQPPTPDKLRNNYEQMLQEIRAYLREMNISERLADDMLKVDPADIRYLSYNELNGYGLTSYDPIEQEIIDLEEARTMGLDRREYIRRQALKKATCGSLTKVEELIACNQRVMKFGR